MASLFGLSVGIACAMVLGMYVQTQFSYDQHFTNSDRIYRVGGQRISDDGNVYLSAPVSPLLGAYLKSNYPEVEDFVRFDSAGGGFVESEDTSYYWDRDQIFITDPNVFQFFNHNILTGNPSTALSIPRSMAVSETFARRYYGRIDILGEVVTHRNVAYTINLVFADLPTNTHFRYDILISLIETTEATRRRAGGERLQGIWLGTENPAYTYVLMPEDYTSEDFEQISDSVTENILQSLLDRSGFTQHFFLEPLKQIHFNSLTDRDFPRGNKFYPIALSFIAVFVLLVAAINYVILAIARAINRQKSLAFQKLLGAEKHQLVFGFVAESIFFCLVALMIGYFLAEISLNLLFANGFLGSEIQASAMFNPYNLGMTFAAIVVIATLAAFYPAAYLSGISISSAFRQAQPLGIGGNMARHVLVTVQFLISIVFVACALFMYLQMQYVTERPLGFETESRLTMRVHKANNIERLPTFIEQIKQHPNVLNSTVSREIPGELDFFRPMLIEDNNFVTQTRGLYVANVDENYLDTFGINLIEGQNLNSILRPGDSYALVNETLVNSMGWDNPLLMSVQRLQVIGVVEDFHFQGLHQPLAPLYMQFHMNYLDYQSQSQRAGQIRTLTISTTGVAEEETLQFIQQTWQAFFPDLPFEYRYLEDAIDSLYSLDRQQMQLMIVLAVLCVVIACLGQYSLTALSIEQRTKEIGIRRTLGATPTQIVTLLFSSICWLLCISGVAAVVLSYLAVTEWLNTYYYRVDVNLWLFVVSACAVAIITFATTALQSMHIIKGNPLEALRYE